MKLSKGWAEKLGLGLIIAGGLALAQPAPAAASGQCAHLEADADLFAHAHEAELVYKRSGKAMTRKVEGVRVRLHPAEGHSVPYLQRLAACQLSQVLGDQKVDGLKVRVKTTGSQFELHISTPSRSAAHTVLERVRSHAGL